MNNPSAKGNSSFFKNTQVFFILFHRYGFTFVGVQNGYMRVENQRKEIEE